MKKLFLLFICLITLTNLKPNTIQGKIKDDTNEEISGVKIVLCSNNTYKTLYSDLNGNYILNDIKSGTYMIILDYISYKVIKSIIIVNNDKVIDFKIEKI